MAKKKRDKSENHIQSSEGTREKLLKTALHLFAKQGYDATTTKQICDAASANIAAVAYHFETKENLLKAIFNERIDRDSSAISLILKEVHSVDEFKIRIRMYCETMLEIVSREPDFHHLVAREASVNPIAFKVMKRGIEEFSSILAKFFHDAKKKGFLAKDVEDGLIGYVLFALLVGVRLDGVVEKIDSQFDFSESKNREHYLDGVLKMLFHGIVSTEVK